MSYVIDYLLLFLMNRRTQTTKTIKRLKTHLAKKRLNTRRKGNKVPISQQGEANKIKNNFKSTTKIHQN